MIELLTVDNHAALRSTPHIRQICFPLFTYTPVNFFNFVRIYKDGRRYSLGTNAVWLEHYFNHQYHNFAAFTYNKECSSKHFMLHGSYSKNIVVIDAAHNFDIHHGITLIKNFVSYIDFYHYATEMQQTKSVEYYLNNIDLLERFALYFYDKVKVIIKIIKPYVPKSCQVLTLENNGQQRDVREKFFEATKIKKIIIDNKKPDFYLTYQEIACLKFLLRSHTSKEVAKKINLSHRTVECYQARIKKRFNLSSISQLLDILDKYQISIDFL